MINLTEGKILFSPGQTVKFDTKKEMLDFEEHYYDWMANDHLSKDLNLNKDQRDVLNRLIDVMLLSNFPVLLEDKLLNE